jgi:hypothetical protein
LQHVAAGQAVFEKIGHGHFLEKCEKENKKGVLMSPTPAVQGVNAWGRLCPVCSCARRWVLLRKTFVGLASGVASRVPGFSWG